MSFSAPTPPAPVLPTAPAAPPSDCISVTDGIVPHILRSPFEFLSSEISPIGELGSRVGYSVKDLKTNKTFFVSVNLVPKDSFTIPR